jgi:hypothetical protein
LTSGRSGRGRLAAALALAPLLLALATPAGAFDVKLWPLFRYARDDVHHEVRWSALGPLVEFTGTPETRDFRIRPLLWLRQRRGAMRDDRADILYPLAASRWQDDYQSFRFLLFTYRWRPAPAAPAGAAAGEPPEARRITLFPFVFYRRSPEHGTHLSVLPFYLDQPDFLGYERVQAVMFPAYLRLVEPRLERRFYGFPFVSTVGGTDGQGVRVWPFYGTTEIVGQERTRYVLWPFHIRNERLVPGYGWESRRIDFPVYAAIDGAARRTRAYGVGAYTHTLDYRQGTESVGAPWPLVFRERRLGDTAWRTWRFAPFYGRSDRDGISSRFYAWPVYRRRTQDVDDFHYQRRDVGLVLWRQQSLRNDASGRREDLLTVFPALRAADDNGRLWGQAPAFLDSLLPRNRAVLALWAPLYGLVRWDTRPDGACDWNLLWGLAAREDGRLLGPWHLAGEGAARGN